MILLLVILVLFVLSIVIFEKTDSDIWLASTLMLGVCLLLFVVILPFHYHATKGEIAEFNSVKETLKVARDRVESIENAALQMKVIDSNKWLASTKYWNSTIFELFIPDEVERLEPIR